ncbi:MAG: hypothetical protein XD63_0896 [Thermoanaerobacterales bacterium 50_218]|nr:MAG: hypothetical protein XD63_0896 [Thermoanaerobacterales bacterium 50_218]HAA89886.1 hypothetical protein [Peptococcaceae bacterium]
MRWAGGFEYAVALVTAAIALLDVGLVMAIVRARGKVSRRLAWRRKLASDWLVTVLEYPNGRVSTWSIPPVQSHRDAIDMAELIVALDDKEGPFAKERVANVARFSRVADYVLEDLTARNVWVRRRAAYLCGRLGLKEVEPKLRLLAEKGKASEALQAMESLCFLGDTSYFPRILENLLTRREYTPYQSSVILSYIREGVTAQEKGMVSKPQDNEPDEAGGCGLCEEDSVRRVTWLLTEALEDRAQQGKGSTRV